MKTWKQRNPDKVKAQAKRRRNRKGRYNIYDVTTEESIELRKLYEIGKWRR